MLPLICFELVMNSWNILTQQISSYKYSCYNIQLVV